MNRNKSVDLIRIIASFGVIAIHVQSSTPSAKFLADLFSVVCVPFFLIASLFYFEKSLSKEINLRENLLRIFQRLYIPFIAWSFIYMALLVAKKAVSHQNQDLSLFRVFVYGHSSAQMYFQPLLINIQLLVLGGVVLFRKKQLAAILLLLLGLTFFVFGDVHDYYGFASHGQYVGISLYILCAYLLIKIAPQKQMNPLFLLSGLLILGCVYLSAFMPALNIALDGYSPFSPIAGFALMLLCFGYNITQLPNWVVSMANNTYGIYLSHIVFLEGFELVSTRILGKGIHFDLLNKIVFTTCIFVAAHAFTSLARKSKLLRFALLGEK